MHIKTEVAVLLATLLVMGYITSSVRAANSDSYFIFPDDYNPNAAPLAIYSDAEIFTMSVNMQVWAVTDVLLQKQLIEVALRVSVEWTDYRLDFNPNVTSNRTWLQLSKQDLDRVWKPTFMFRNCKGCPPISVDHQHNTDLYVLKNTTYFFAKHQVLNHFTCAINLRAYPMDIQICPVQLYVYEETNDAMMLRHLFPDYPALILSNLTLSAFNIPPVAKGDCTFTEDDETYACLEIQIHLEHLLMYHIMTAYAPTSFIVIVSWISFWLPVDMAPARVALGLTSILTLATRMDQAQKDLPAVAYVKAIDIWMFACIFLVSTSLCEFAVSHYIWRLNKMVVPTVTMPTVDVNPDSKGKIFIQRQSNNSASVKQVSPYMPQKESMAVNPPIHSAPPTHLKDGTSLDRVSRIAFPISFIFFNIVYWSYYLGYYK